MLLSEFVAQHTQLPLKNIDATLALLNEGGTIPFISRYRKERTGNLNEVQIEQILTFKEQFETLEKRKESILKLIEEQHALTPELIEKIKNAQSLTVLEDLYLPYKKKRSTKTEIAKKRGLEPLAKIIMAQHSQNINRDAAFYLNDDVLNEEDALEGARHIIAEWINERIDIRNLIRYELEHRATINTKAIKTKKEEETAQKYRDYFEWTELLHKCPSHRLLAILRAEKEGFIKVKINIDDEKILKKIHLRIIKNNNSCTSQIEKAIDDSYKRLIFPSLVNEQLNTAKENADKQAISVFAKNLKQLLLGAPLGEKRILAIDPGFRTGCKIVCLNSQGDLEYNETIYPHPPQNDTSGAIKKISSLTDAYKIEAIAIGNGTASRETEQLIKRIKFKNPVEVFIVNEAGASVYSASKIAREEFPNFDVTVRGAVSIGRRLADPLAELVKIEPKAIGVGQYQHDVDQIQLKTSLDHVVENCVNTIGVNINTASVSLLSYVAGIGSKIAENIVAFRNQHGVFTNREQIKQVPRLGDKAFEQSAAFLRIKNAENPLDDSAVHPESYSVVEHIIKKEGKPLPELIGNKEALQKINLNHYIQENIGLPTLQDIIKELEKPGADVRKKAKVFTFNQNIRSITDLKEGQLLPGIVNNITNFGCFVDIGIKESGLIHISNLSDSFVQNVNEYVQLHQQIIVKVLEVDISRKRIQLALHKGDL